MENNQSTIAEYINSKKEIYRIVLDFFENEEESLNDELINNLDELIECANIEDIKTIFHIILSISNNHQRNFNFKTKIFNIFNYLANTLKQTMTNSETFEFFKSNKLIILYLIKNQIIKLDEQIIDKINKDISYCYFFYPEISQFLKEEEKEEVKKKCYKLILIYLMDLKTNVKKGKMKVIFVL